MESILVTGGSGYIGSVLVPRLLAAGYAVTVLDSLAYGQCSLLPCCANPAFTFLHGDVCDGETLARLVRGFDIVIPLAAMVGAPLCKRMPTAASQVNVEAVRTIIENLSPGQRVLFPNTNSGYGVGDKESLCTEDSPLNPLSHYARTKVEAERLCLDSGAAVTFRLATVFGVSPRLRLDLMVNDFTYRAFRDHSIVLFEESFRRNFIHVQDVAATFLFAIEHFDEMKGRSFNVGLSTANLTKRQLCERIKQQVPDFHIMTAAFAEDPDKRDYCVSNERLEGLGWRPTVSLDDGIRELLMAFRLLQFPSVANA